jgi:molybdopterin-dependent oxidoreductase alpha subunit
MVQTKTNNINPQPPLAFTGLKLSKPSTEAAGIKAVLASAKHVFGAMPVSRGLKALLKLNQKHGIDCPSCAWPDPDHRSPIAEYCENGAKAIAEDATTRKITSALFQRYSVADLSDKSDYWLGQQGRLTQPMILREGQTHYEKISYQEAFALIGNKLKNLPTPNDAIFYTSGRTSNEGAFLYQLFVRMYGTNNMPDCSNMCHESSGAALTATLGLGKGSVTLADFDKAEVIIVMGQNPGTNHPRMLTALENAKRKGAKIVSINPLIEAGLLAFKNPQDPRDLLTGATSLTDIYLQVRINQDLALLKCILKLLVEADKLSNGQVFDKSFIREDTIGFEELIEHLNGYSIAKLATQSGVELSEIQRVADLLAVHNRIIVCWAMGLTQHKNSVITIQEVVNLLLLKGSIGKEGAGTCPVRGHSNVQGDRTMGIYEKPSQTFLDNIERVFGFKPPQDHGYDTVEAIQEMYKSKGKVFIAMGGNFLSATPDTEYTAKALMNCDLTVHISTKLNRSHLVHGSTALILPTLGRTDLDIQKDEQQFITVEDSMGVVHISKGVLSPPSEELLSEPAIVAGIAKQSLDEKYQLNWDELIANYDNIRNLIEKTIPGFDNYNVRVRDQNGFYLPNPPREGKFTTNNQMAHFTINRITPEVLKENEYLMMTIRSHDQFNTTIYGLNDRYRGIYNERRIIMMNEKDIADANLKNYQVVDLHNNHGGIHREAQRFIIVPYNIPTKCVATYFPESNPLVPIDSTADTSNTPTSKSVVITIDPVVEDGKVVMAEVRD